jgi:hypothetical protein
MIVIMSKRNEKVAVAYYKMLSKYLSRGTEYDPAVPPVRYVIADSNAAAFHTPRRNDSIISTETGPISTGITLP